MARGLVDREDLLQRLDRAVAKRVTIISAPPGSGKTSLLRAWSGRPGKDHRVAFVSVPRDQRDAQQFWLAVLDAIHRSATSIDSGTRTTALGLDGDAMIDTIVAELAERAEVVVLIIDDLHELRSADALVRLEHLCAILPSSARMVLSSRRDPPIRLPQLRLADEVAEIRAADLRFTQRETRELLAASGIGLADSGAAALYQRTEGWAAGLRLAVISLSAHPDPERFVAEFSGTDRAIEEYLMSEMLERQPSEVQTMLLRTSLVDRLNGELADLLARRSGAEQILLELEDANAFVVSLDAQRTWFRYHHLLADFLRLELRRRLAGEVPDLHRRAARWLADHGEVVEAVRHTLAAGDWPDAARLLADHLFSLTLDGQEETVAALLRSFPAGASADHPELALAHAATHLAQGSLEEAATQLALAESHVQLAPPARRRRLSVATASLRLALARRSGQFAEVIEQVKLLDGSIADGSNEPAAMSSELRAVALMNLGIVETWSGRFDDAERHLSEGAILARAIDRPYVELACRAHQGFPSTFVSLATARERARQAVALAERHGWDDRPIVTPALAAVAGSAIWMGEFDEGERWLRRAWTVADPQIDPAAVMLVHMSTGMLHAARGEHDLALKAFAAAARAQSLLTGVYALASPIIGWLAATQARLGRSGEARAALAEFAEFGRRLSIFNPRAVVFLAEGDPATAVDALGDAQDIARAAICLAEGDPSAALDVLGDVQGMAPPLGSAFPPFGLVEAQVLAGIAFLRLGDRNAAAGAVEAALAAAERDRLIFPFAMSNAAELLDALPRQETAHGALLTDILDLLRGGSSASTDREQLPQEEELSPSELRVLRYLPTNLTRPEIASELYVSVNTVNTHIRSVYSKLGARDRSSAVRRARELGLLSSGLARTSPS